MRDYKDTERVDRRIKEMIKQNVVFVENKAGSLKTGLIFMDLHASMHRSLQSSV